MDEKKRFSQNNIILFYSLYLFYIILIKKKALR